MAAVTVVSVYNNVDGSVREDTYVVNIAANGDTLTTSNSAILSVEAFSVAADAIGTTTAGGVVTFVTGGAEAGATVIVKGW